MDTNVLKGRLQMLSAKISTKAAELSGNKVGATPDGAGGKYDRLLETLHSWEQELGLLASHLDQKTNAVALQARRAGAAPRQDRWRLQQSAADKSADLDQVRASLGTALDALNQALDRAYHPTSMEAAITLAKVVKKTLEPKDKLVKVMEQAKVPPPLREKIQAHPSDGALVVLLSLAIIGSHLRALAGPKRQ